MSKYVKYQCHLDLNEIPLEAVNITDGSMCTEEILTDNNVDQRNPYNKSENNNSTKINASEKK